MHRASFRFLVRVDLGSRPSRRLRSARYLLRPNRACGPGRYAAAGLASLVALTHRTPHLQHLPAPIAREPATDPPCAIRVASVNLILGHLEPVGGSGLALFPHPTRSTPTAKSEMWACCEHLAQFVDVAVGQRRIHTLVPLACPDRLPAAADYCAMCSHSPSA